MKEPNGLDLLATLINLLADQEGVEISYVLEQKGETRVGVTGNQRKAKKGCA